MARRHPRNINPEDLKLTKSKFKTVGRLWKELLSHRGLLFFVLFLILLSTMLGILGPYLIGYAIDQFIYHQTLSGFVPLLTGLITVYFFYSFTSFLQNYSMIGIAQETVYSMRTRLFSHLQQLPVSFFDNRQHGEIMSRLTNDMDNVSSTLNSSVIQIFSSVLTLSGTIIFMVWLSPLLTMITLTIVPLLYIGMKWITKRTSKYFKEQQKHLGQLNGFIEETISSQKIIKSYSQEQFVLDEFFKKSNELKKAGFWAQSISGFIPKLMNMLNNLSFSLIVFLGGLLALNDSVTVGLIVTFTEYARQFTRPLHDLANQYNQLLSAVAGAERVYQILDEDKEEIDELKAERIEHLNGNVEFQNVSFSYGREENTIKNISFSVKTGQTVALVGPTGAGKSTIINLLMRLYEPHEGAIYIDGINIQKITRESLRSFYGFVLQEVFLFEDTIRENIRFGQLDASDEEVEAAAKKANAHSFIMKLPNGYDTKLTEDGAGISQGQKQLISIARAILRNPTILILDEATSNIDTVTEIQIQEALQCLMKNRTTFVIAHRLNTIQNADQILVIHDGEIIERGNHESLLKKNGIYSNMYKQKEGTNVV
ncbi:ABC transporter ATP-binding protein/permease [Caldibacillus thermolactis]|uniref:ABC transporter ATP-binding protein/permease n=1 Tax=Pallidibacillus thermolactis TaxID=251051 RepID=A0ABT2WIX6_9BACI|nr:ABC transporter ATP-binding protein [Pallidibacillus thermolactis]MCU9595620.1 ABC transporter ATP-binding protein/permease [Pallidibacillus thermolactis]